MINIYLVRHGENIANITKEFSCKKVDYSLTEKGIIQSEQTGHFFKDKKIDYIFASPLKRACETAQIIGNNLSLNYKVIEDFREINVGDLEGKIVENEHWEQYKEIVTDWNNGLTERKFPGGENYNELIERMKKGIAETISDITSGNIIIVAHGGIISYSIQEICTHMEKQDILNLDSQNCSVTKIKMIDNNFKLQYWADSTHLTGKAAKQVVALPED